MWLTLTGLLYIICVTNGMYGDLPNIIIIYTDDTFYHKNWNESNPNKMDFTYDVPTHGIDRIRRNGVIIPKSYASSTNGGPSRYSLLTGKYPSRCEYAINKTIKYGKKNIKNGTLLTAINPQHAKLSSNIENNADLIDNLPAILSRM